VGCDATSSHTRPCLVDCASATKNSAEEILAIVDPDILEPVDMMEVLIRILDDSRLRTFSVWKDRVPSRDVPLIHQQATAWE